MMPGKLDFMKSVVEKQWKVRNTQGHIDVFQSNNSDDKAGAGTMEAEESMVEQRACRGDQVRNSEDQAGDSGCGSCL